jgi:hypothetical protein
MLPCFRPLAPKRGKHCGCRPFARNADAYADHGVEEAQQRLAPGVGGTYDCDDHDNDCRNRRRDDVLAPIEQHHHQCSNRDENRDADRRGRKNYQVEPAEREAHTRSNAFATKALLAGLRCGR